MKSFVTMNSNIKYISFIPLIGGMALANAKAAGKKPEFVLSYEAFAKNESNLQAYWPDVEWHLLDPDTNTLTEDIELDYSDIDFVSSVCPCAGLSTMSKTHSPDSEINDWLYKSSEYILGTIKPKVYFGENAPGLYSDINAKVADRLKGYAKQYGYSFTIYKTDTRLHGIPQRRVRTFFFFWKGDSCPLMEYYDNQSSLPYEEWILDKNIGLHNELPTADPLKRFAAFKWIYEEICGSDYSKYIEFLYSFYEDGKRIISPYDYIVHYDRWDDYIAWLKRNPIGAVTVTERGKHTHLSIAEYRMGKIKAGMNYFSKEPVIFKGVASAITGKNAELSLHPKERRFLTVREIMSLMGLPEDFELVTGNTIHITQNVPVCTAKDMTDQVIKFINGELEMTDSQFVKQSNITRKVDAAEKFEEDGEQ